ncbi:hypothetical protein BDZ89DRAFT_961154 [Hymenopellis radicata]|nr:hypothetical protein BDZ89DRAFT_961154 [Hymenopellis radicata]
MFCVFAALSHSGMSMSFTTALNTVSMLAKRAVARAAVFSMGPHMFTYDNINLKTSIFVEQVPGAMPKVQSGTFPILYELWGVVNPDDLLLQPLLDNLKVAKDLTLPDVLPTIEGQTYYLAQTEITIVKALLRYMPDFSKTDRYTAHPALQYTPRRPLPLNSIKKFYPLKTTTIEEASIDGNLQFHDETRMVFTIGSGLFHLIMNYAWCLLNKHRFKATQLGSLSRYFLILEKKRLAGEKPDYHTLMAALGQIRDGLLMDAWRQKCGYASLEAFAASNPAPGELTKIASEILYEFATPIPEPLNDSDRKPSDDIINQNTRLLLRDLLYLHELTDAVSSGDFGRIEDILPDIAAIFRGGGSNNYCTEILHLLDDCIWTYLDFPDTSCRSI